MSGPSLCGIVICMLCKGGEGGLCRVGEGGLCMVGRRCLSGHVAYDFKEDQVL